MLRASSQTLDLAVNLDLSAVVTPDTDSGLPHGTLLIAFADAVLGKDKTALDTVRSEMLTELGQAALVDAAGVVATFMQMVRIADATGIAIGTAILEKTQDVRETLGINTFASAQNTLGPNA